MRKKHLPQQLEYKEKVATYIVESISDAIIATDLKFHIVGWNKAAEKMYGWKAIEVMGKKVNMILFQKSSASEMKELVTLLLAQGFWKGSIVQTKRDGTTVNITSSVSMVKDDLGNSILIVAVNRDNTERIQLENRKDEFLGIASHELRTPLTSIKGYIQILERLVATHAPTDKVMDFLNRTDTYTDRLNGLINDLLDVSKIQAGKLVLNKSRFELDDLLQESIESIEPTAPKHSIIYKNRTKINIIGDRDRLEQVITNLLSNAIKYSPKPDKIVVTATVKNNRIKIAVKDFGIGIPKSKQSLLFQRYYRVEDTEKTFSGMGIGLYISNEIVERHNGTISVKSDGIRGTTFEVELPLA